MNTETDTIDPLTLPAQLKARALKDLKGAFYLYLTDLQTTPEEAFTRDFGGKSRTISDMTYEVNLVLDHVGLTIRGEELFEWPEGWVKAPPDYKTKDAVIAAFTKSSDRIVETVEALSESALFGIVNTERGETTRFERCQFMALHTWYHSGQLNFIQTLLGDDNLHW